jgi:hypothetical protein
MKTLSHLGPSPEHAKYQALLPQFWDRVRRQEETALAAGIPVDGLYAFARKWFDAWSTQNIDLIADCLTEDCGHIDSSTFQRNVAGGAATVDSCLASFEVFPDFAFYPQDGSVKSLPYLDYFEDTLRLVIPWRGVGRWTGPLRVPGIDSATMAPTGRCLNFIGVDRYVMRRVDGELKIAHIDTDWDIVLAMIQLAPIAPSSVSERAIKISATFQRAVVPVLRALTRNATPNGARMMSIPLNSKQAVVTLEEKRLALANR